MVYNCIDMENTNSISHERARLKSLLERYEYGRIPPSPAHLSTKTAEIDKAFAAGKAELISFEIICYFDDEGYSFPITAAILGGFCVMAYVANILLDYNYMFLMHHDNTPYSIFYNLLNGSPIFYPLFVVGVFVAYIVLFYHVHHVIIKKSMQRIK